LALILIRYKLRPGVTREAFETWLRTANSAALKKLTRVKSFTVYRVERRVMGSGEPSMDYFDFFDIPDIAGYIAEDLPSPDVRKDMEEFRGFADDPEYLLVQPVASGP
jgi:hypothetical protein